MKSMFKLIAALTVVVVMGAPQLRAEEMARQQTGEETPVMVFYFELVDTSLEGELKGKNPAEQKRLGLITTLLRTMVDESDRYQTIGDAAEIEKFGEDHNLQGCNGCDATFAKEKGAKIAISGTVQKVSNLILNLNLYLRDADTGRLIKSMSTDIRSNSDDSWQRAVRSIVTNQLLNKDA